MALTCARSLPWFAREIGLDAAQPFFGLGLAVMADHRGKQADIVIVVAGPGAYLAAPFRVGKFFVGRYFALTDTVLRRVEDARPQGQPVPETFRMPVFGGHRCGHDVAFYRLGQACVDHFVEARDIDSDHQIGRAVAAFRLKPGDETFRCVDDIYLDPGFLGKGVEQVRFLVVTIGVNVHFPCGVSGGGCGDYSRDRRRHDGKNGKKAVFHPGNSLGERILHGSCWLTDI